MPDVTLSEITADQSILASFVIFGTLLLMGCGGGGAITPTIPPTITPLRALLLTRQTQQFSFAPGSGGSSAVTWSVNGVAGGNSTYGTVDQNGLYTAPTVPPSPNIVTVRGQNSAGFAEAFLAIISPTPSVASVTPAATTAGSGDTLIMVSGAGFTPQSVIQAGGNPLATTFISESELTATLSAATLANIGVTQLAVSTPLPGGGTSSGLQFTTVSPGAVSATAHPMVATYAITSPRDAKVTIEFGLDITYGLRTWTQPTPTGGGAVSIFVAGMRALSTYHMRAVVDFPDGTEFLDADHTFTTGGPTSVAPAPDMVYSNPNGLTPTSGVVLFHSSFGPQNNLATTAYDTRGNLIWYFDPGYQNYTAQPAKLLPNGHFIINVSGPVEEIDLAGDVIRTFGPADVTQWLANAGINVTLYSLHHDLLILPNGHLMLLANTFKTFTDLPGLPGDTQVLGDVLIEVDQNNNVVWYWSTFDHLDVNRHPVNLPDWTHSNAIIYSPDDGNVLLSMRAQSWVIKIDYQNGRGTGNILWHLGYQGDFTISSGNVSDWQYGQHFPIIVSPNSTGVFNLMVYDNGDSRVLDTNGTICGTTGFMGPQVAGTIPCYTRAVNFQLDENAKTAAIAWQYNFSPTYSFWGGSTQLLSSGNYAIDLNAPDSNTSSATYMEVTPGANPQIVFEMNLPYQFAYRAIHMPSLYPGVQW